MQSNDQGRLTGYQHLETRPDSTLKQPYLKGRRIAVGHLMGWLAANHATPEETAENFDVPAAQMLEVITYYNAHRDFVDGEFAAQAAAARRQGIPFDSSQNPHLGNKVAKRAATALS